MATSYNQGLLHSYDITALTADASVAQRPDRRYLFGWRDKVHELNPVKSPFFAYLGKLGKEPVSSPVFRFLENRAKTDWTAKDFRMVGTIGTVVAGNAYNFVVDNGTDDASVDWLVKGDTFNVTTVKDTGGLAQIMVRIEDEPSIGTNDTSFSGKIIAMTNDGVSGYNVLTDEDLAKATASAFPEGSGAPDSVSSEIEDGFAYVQDVRTSCELTDVAMATEYRGYKNEWTRLWAEKLDDHAAKWEKISLFNIKAKQGNLLYSDGIVGNILLNATVVADTTAFTYSSGSSYFRSITKAELSYDLILGDMEVLFHPARGGSNKKLVLASFPIITFFNKVADGNFIDTSLGYSNSVWQQNMDKSKGSFGHQILIINTVHGSLHLVAEPFFDGAHKSFMLMADMSNVKYCYMSGNGINLDTYITTNVQARDETLRKDVIRTVAGMKITLPETHMLYSVEDV